MNPRERAAIQRHADAGDTSALAYLKILTACETVLAQSDGISHARGMVGEHNDIYAQAIDEAISVLMPYIFVAANVPSFNELQWYVPSLMVLDDDGKPLPEKE